MNPEMPFLAGGAVVLLAGVARERAIPKNSIRAVMGTVVLVLIASLTNGTAAAPLIRAIGFLFLFACVVASVKIVKGMK